MAGVSGSAAVARLSAFVRAGRAVVRTRTAAVTTVASLVAWTAACQLPDEPDPPVVETVYLLDAIDGLAPPRPVCEAEATMLLLRFESIALAADGSYGRLQETQLGENPPTQQEERGDFTRTDSTIVLENGAGALVTLALLDAAGEHVRRLHACGDTLRYESVPVGDVE